MTSQAALLITAAWSVNPLDFLLTAVEPLANPCVPFFAGFTIVSLWHGLGESFMNSVLDDSDNGADKIRQCRIRSSARGSATSRTFPKREELSQAQ